MVHPYACRLLMRAEERPDLDDSDEFYAQQLTGLDVVLSDEGHERDGLVLGRVTDVYDGTGHHDVLCIEFVAGMVLRARDGMLVDLASLNTEV